MSPNTSSLDRRSFLQSAGIAAASVCAIGSAMQSEYASADEESQSANETGAGTDDHYECDIVIVGAGFTGLAAAVQSAQNGMKTIVIESQSVVGGNGLGVEGSFGMNSILQQELGIEFTLAEILRSELEGSQWRADGLFWKDFITASGENISWLIDQGVEFTGAVESYGTASGAMTFHWFKDGTAASGYIPQMEAKANELGVEFLLQTRADSLVMADDTVVGIEASDAEGNTIKIDAGAVIFAAGGFGSNNDLIAKLGFDIDNIYQIGTPGHDGATYQMAIDAGAKDTIHEATFNANSIILALPHEVPIDPINGCVGIGQGGPFLWINQNGERFVDENLAAVNFELQTVPGCNQEKMFTVFDTAIIDTWANTKGIDVDEMHAIFDASLESNEADSFYRANTIEELADLIGVDPQAFIDTVERYNELADAGEDTDFGKDATQLQPLTTPPYYAGRVTVEFLFSCGGIGVNRKYEVIKPDNTPIAGLYAVGNDANMLYRDVYTIDVPGTCSSSGIYAARTAANSAAVYIAG